MPPFQQFVSILFLNFLQRPISYVLHLRPQETDAIKHTVKFKIKNKIRSQIVRF